MSDWPTVPVHLGIHHIGYLAAMVLDRVRDHGWDPVLASIARALNMAALGAGCDEDHTIPIPEGLRDLKGAP